MYTYVYIYVLFLSTHSGMYKEKKELCLDCRSQAAEHVVQQCQVNGHEATVVVYSDAEKRELVPVYWPVNASKVRWFTVKADHVRTCCDRMKCSLPHHYLERRILNLWREVTVATDTRPSPVRIPNSFRSIYVCRLHFLSSLFLFMQRMFLAELKRAVAINKKVSYSIIKSFYKSIKILECPKTERQVVSTQYVYPRTFFL